MNLIKIIDGVSEWLEEAVCSKVSYKVPDDEESADGYGLEEEHPRVFPLYVPTAGMEEEGEYITPSICVQMLQTEDDLLTRDRIAPIRLHLSVWNPGLHSEELYRPKEDDQSQIGRAYTRRDDETYIRRMQGYKDILNFADRVINEIEKTEYIAGMTVDRSKKLVSAPHAEDGIVWCYYPYWHWNIEFSLKTRTTEAIPEKYADLL